MQMVFNGIVELSPDGMAWLAEQPDSSARVPMLSEDGWAHYALIR